MSLFTFEEICEGCENAVFHDCCGRFCRCRVDADPDHIRGKCSEKIEEIHNHIKVLERIDDGETFSQNNDGTYSMDSMRKDMPTTYYRYSYKRLMETGAFREKNKETL